MTGQARIFRELAVNSGGVEKGQGCCSWMHSAGQTRSDWVRRKVTVSEREESVSSDVQD